MSEYQTILYERHDHVARIILNRPQQKNAQSRLLLEELDAAFAAAVADDNIHVIVLAGAGEHFSSGHDLGTAEERDDALRRPYPEGPEGEYERSVTLFVDFCLRWRELPKPTIAEVQGFCIFGGFMIATVMDFIVASDDAMFLPSHLQLFTAPWVLGPRKTKEILYEGRFIPAAEGLALGLVNRVEPRDGLTASVMAQARRISESGPFRLRIMKRSTNQAEDAMGYRVATQSAHGNYMILQNGGRVRQGDETQLSGVGRALKLLQDGN